LLMMPPAYKGDAASTKIPRPHRIAKPFLIFPPS
jgi:hypothetical protein